MFSVINYKYFPHYLPDCFWLLTGIQHILFWVHVNLSAKKINLIIGKLCLGDVLLPQFHARCTFLSKNLMLLYVDPHGASMCATKTSGELGKNVSFSLLRSIILFNPLWSFRIRWIYKFFSEKCSLICLSLGSMTLSTQSI